MAEKDEGRIFRDGNRTIVEVRGTTGIDKEPGVICVNPDAPEIERIYRKIFERKLIYLPEEGDRARREVLMGNDVIVIGMNGYSSLNAAKCAAYGIRPGAYEAACCTVLTVITEELQRRFRGVDVRFAHGASDLGVDRSIMNVANDLNLRQLGHSCPHFMFYVKDDDVPVLVAPTQAEYAKQFIISLDILVGANGRMQAFEMDIDAAFKHRKHVIPINVMRRISNTGGPPAFGSDGSIEDAVAAFQELVHGESRGLDYSPDPWEDLLEHVKRTATFIGRRRLSPTRAYGR